MRLGPTRITLPRLGDGMPTNCIKVRVEPPQPGSGERRRGADSSAGETAAVALRRRGADSRRAGKRLAAPMAHVSAHLGRRQAQPPMEYRCAVTVMFAAHVWPTARRERRERRLDGPRLSSESARAGHAPRPILRHSLPPPPAFTESLLSPCDSACAGPPGDE